MKDDVRMLLPNPEDVVPTYESVAADVARARSGALQERRWLDRALAYAPGRSALDLGCGTGRPIAAYLADRRCRMTGVDGSAAMCGYYAAMVPGAEIHQADMRGLDLATRFDLILAWDSLTHLTPSDQQAMFAVFAAHARPRTVLLFTSGAAAAEGTGKVAGVPVYRASLSPDAYRRALAASGIELLDFVPDDPGCGGQTVWMARFTGH